MIIMKKSLYLAFAIFGIIGILGFPYTYAHVNPIEGMNEVVTQGACTSLEGDLGTGFMVAPVLLTDCSLSML